MIKSPKCFKTQIPTLCNVILNIDNKNTLFNT